VISPLFLLLFSFRLHQGTYSPRASADMNLSCKGAVTRNIPKTLGSCNPQPLTASCTEIQPRFPSELRPTHLEVVRAPGYHHGLPGVEFSVVPRPQPPDITQPSRTPGPTPRIIAHNQIRPSDYYLTTSQTPFSPVSSPLLSAQPIPNAQMLYVGVLKQAARVGC